MDTTNDLNKHIKQMMVRDLMLQIAPEEIADDQPLFGPGSLGLDSVDALQLVVGLDKQFGLKIPDPATARQVLATVSTIAAVRTRNDSIRADGSWAVAEREDLSPATRTSERIALGLRTRRGVDEVAFARDFGFDLRERWAIAIARLVEEGLAEARPPFRLTRKGWLVADEVVQLFL